MYMKKIFSLITVGAALVFGTLGVTSCHKAQEITQVEFTNVMTPTNLNGFVTSAGDVIRVNWSKAKGADCFEMELYSDVELTNLLETRTILPGELPADIKLLPDESYYYRVRGLAEDKEPSKWAVYADDNGVAKALKTYAIKSSAKPALVDRTSTSITVSWELEEGDTELTHVVAQDNEGKEVEAKITDLSAGQVTIEGLVPSTQYEVTLHYLSAGRGSLSVWTRPAEDGATKVATAAALKQAVTDGASFIAVEYSEEPYLVSSMVVTGDFKIVGESSPSGAKPVINGSFEAAAGLTSFHAEDLDLNGEAAGEGEGAVSLQGHVLKLIGNALTDVEFVNCDVHGYQKGLYSDEKGSSISGHLLLDGVYEYDILGSGGDNIDARLSYKYKALTVQNSTFTRGCRTFMRFDADGTVGEVKVTNCTFNNMCYDGSALKIGGSNVQGIFAFKGTFQTFDVTNCLFLNNQCWLVGGNSAVKIPSFNKNYTFNCVEQFYTSAKLDGTSAKSGMSLDVVVKGGAQLTSDPCYNSEDGILNLTEKMLVNDKIGDPRWFVSYVVVPEDLTLPVTKAVKTWDFTNKQVFKPVIAEDMVRDGIRFFVKNSPVNIDNTKGQIIFPTASKVSSLGEVSDCGLGIRIGEPGSLVISTESTGKAGATIVVALNGKAKAAVVAGAERQQIVFEELPVGAETVLTIYATERIAISELQWNAETVPVVNPQLAAPAVTVDPRTATQGTTITAAWDAVEGAASYEVSVDEGKATAVSALTFDVKTASLEPGEHTVKVVAIPAADDLLRKKSVAGEAVVTIKEKPAPTPGGVAGKIVFDDYVGQNPATISDGSITMTATLGASEDKTKKLVVDANSCYFGTADAQVKFASRLKTGGKNSATNAITLTIEEGAAGKLKVYARTGTNSDVTRTIAITGAAGEILSHTFVEADDKISVFIPDEGANKDVYKVLEAEVTAGTYDVTYPVSGINIYCFEFVPSGAPGPVPVSKSWDFSSEAWQTELAKMGESGKDITGVWDITVDDLNYSASKSRWTTKAIQVTQADIANGVFTYTAPAAGTFTITASATGSSPSGERGIVVRTGGDASTDQNSENCNVSSSGDPKTVTIDVSAGEQKIFLYGGALRIYSIAFQSK